MNKIGCFDFEISISKPKSLQLISSITAIGTMELRIFNREVGEQDKYR